MKSGNLNYLEASGPLMGLLYLYLIRVTHLRIYTTTYVILQGEFVGKHIP